MLIRWVRHTSFESAAYLIRWVRRTSFEGAAYLIREWENVRDKNVRSMKGGDGGGGGGVGDTNGKGAFEVILFHMYLRIWHRKS